jgi:hypothetical protein
MPEQTDDQFLQMQLLEQRLQEANELVKQLKLVTKSKSEGGAKEME